MTMFSMKPKFVLSEFLAESAPKKGPGPNKSQKKETPKTTVSQGGEGVTPQETDTRDRRAGKPVA